MPPRKRVAASSSASTRANAGNQSGGSSDTMANNSTTTSRGRKRKSTESDPSSKPKRGKQAKEVEVIELDATPDEERKPRLTTPDLEFDFDRSQLRDPRPTPGRVKRPRWDEYDMPEGFKDRFYVPEPEKPKGRLNSTTKNELFRKASILDPSASFHDLYVCHRKGRRGSPTYDTAGFRLDWEKVNNWMKPTSYSRRGAVNGMARALDRHDRESRTMHDIFFVDGKGPNAERSTVDHYLRDHVSKDLGIPWHQIGPGQLFEWEKRGFPKQNAEEWWREPNEVERARFLKMLGGASLRKDL
ncbi:hypothetical protein F5Y13DRAFT_199645 [Hypoxylon sp. FL1857]|nr:hypothetical protein F5Y13DRAFT_199645 [Hypoxylon sp. FL1857]